jgi:adenylate cyclase
MAMGIEIERKFLIENDNWRCLAKGVHYRQGYLSKRKERIVRIRTVNGKGYLTIKGETQGAKRVEYEYEIPEQDCIEMLAMLEKHTAKQVIEKKRYIIKYKGHIWEIDEFFGGNQGLIVAEIELEFEEQQFEKPDWVGKEVTYDPRYFNSNLINHPYKKW